MAQVVTCTAAAFFFGEGLRVSAASKKVSEPALIGACPFCVELCMGSFSSEITSATWFTLDCGSFSTLLNTSTRASLSSCLKLLFNIARIMMKISTNERPALYCSQPIGSSFALGSQPFLPKILNLLREAPLKFMLGAFGHCPFSFCTPRPALKRALWGTFFRADLTNFVKSPF